MAIERITKLGILGWSLAALAAEIWLLRGAWPGLPVATALGFAGAALLSAVDRRVIGVVLALTYVFPALVFLYLGHQHAQYIDAWLALLLGATLPRSSRTSWHIPARWRGALVCWALVTIAGATIVVLREMDIPAALFDVVEGAGAWPPFMVRWVIHVALVTTTGILWFDWLVGESDLDFDRVIALPLGVSAAGLAIVAVYQLFVDVSFLNPTVYASLRRASGTVFDANVAGTLAALWMGGALLLAKRHPRTAAYVIAVATLIGWLAVWATGSRTAFAAAALVTTFNVKTMLASVRISSPLKGVVATALVIAAAALLLLLSRTELGVVGPLARFGATAPEMSIESVRATLWEQLWNRNGYGGASTAMIGRYPWFGVGVGSFQTMLPEFVAESGGQIPPDNAQNWYRHQVAELGIVGSIPWLFWVVTFGWYLLDRRRDRHAEAWSARGMLIAFAVISFLGMPGQEPMVAMTFWTMACWFMRFAGAPDAHARGTWFQAATALVLVIFTAGTFYASRHDLRVAQRAQRLGWNYSYGFLRPDASGFGPGPGWTGKRAVAVFDAQSDWLVLTLSADYRAVPGSPFAGSSPPAPTRPAGVTVWCNGTEVVDAQLETTAPAVHFLRVPVGKRWLLLESRVHRTVPLQQLGIDDDREIGVLMQWHGVPAPAPGASVVDCGAL